MVSWRTKLVQFSTTRRREWGIIEFPLEDYT
jgi:hypothetical protein